MDMETLMRLGPVAVATGTFLEGEGALLLAGAGVALGVMDFWPVAGAAFAGCMAGDQFFFGLGRLKGREVLRSRPRFRRRVRRAERFLLRYRWPSLLGYRFVYGTRGIIPFAFGVSALPWRSFLAVNLGTAGVWSLGITYLAVHAAHILTAQPWPVWLLLAAAGLLGGRFLWRRFKARFLLPDREGSD